MTTAAAAMRQVYLSKASQANLTLVREFARQAGLDQSDQRGVRIYYIVNWHPYLIYVLF